MNESARKDIELRTACLEDLATLVTLHMRAFAGHRAVRLGASYVRAGHRWFLTAPDAVNVVALHGHEVVGFVEGAPAGYAVRMSHAVRMDGIKALLPRPWLLLDGNMRYAIARRIRWWLGTPESTTATPHSPDDRTMSLVSIAVAEEFRGLGIAGKLMTEFEVRARAAGATKLRLSVYRSNASAARAYVKAGWSKVETKDEYADYYQKRIA